jgi:hypothetical protein
LSGSDQQAIGFRQLLPLNFSSKWLAGFFSSHKLWQIFFVHPASSVSETSPPAHHFHMPAADFSFAFFSLLIICQPFAGG